MAEVFKIKKGDTKPYLSAQLKSTTGSVIDLSGYNAYFNLATADGQYTPQFSGACVITNTTNGHLEYQWSSSDTNRSGTYLGEFELISGNTIWTFPSDHSLYIKFYNDYDN